MKHKNEAMAARYSGAASTSSDDANAAEEALTAAGLKVGDHVTHLWANLRFHYVIAEVEPNGNGIWLEPRVVELVDHDELEWFGAAHISSLTKDAAAEKNRAHGIEILHERFPDDECGIGVYVGGKLERDGGAVVTRVENIDPGRGYSLTDWREMYADYLEIPDDERTEFEQACIDAYCQAEQSSSYIDHSR